MSTGFLTVATDPVMRAGGHTADTALDWSRWAVEVGLACDEVAAHVHSWRLARAAAAYAAHWRPAATRIAVQVEVLGDNVAAAGAVTATADADAVTGQAATAHTAVNQASALSRPINFARPPAGSPGRIRTG